MKISVKQTVKVLIVLTAISMGLSSLSLYYSFQGTGELESSAGTSGTTDTQSKIQQIREEVLPDEGTATGYGVKYSTAGMQSMVGWFKNIELSTEEKDRYANIGSNDGTACEYCCGATSALRSSGQIACGCEHNLAIAGLIKHFVKNTDKTNEEILKEVKNWKGYFFPKQTLSKELQKQGVSPEAAGLPQMRGGC